MHVSSKNISTTVTALRTMILSKQRKKKKENADRMGSAGGSYHASISEIKTIERRKL